MKSVFVTGLTSIGSVFVAESDTLETSLAPPMLIRYTFLCNGTFTKKNKQTNKNLLMIFSNHKKPETYRTRGGADATIVAFDNQKLFVVDCSNGTAANIST